MTDTNELTVLAYILCCFLAPMDRDFNPNAPSDSNPNELWGVPLVLTGPPGTGKSKTAEMMCHDMHVPFGYLNMGQILPESLSGIPVMDGRGGVIYACPEPGLITISDAQEGVVLFDEINMATLEMMRLIQAGLSTKKIGGRQLPPRTRMLAIKNPRECSTGHTDFSAPVANRFCHMPWDKATSKIYARWRTGQDAWSKLGTLHELERRVRAGWQKVNPSITGQILGFHKRKEEAVHDMPEEGSPAASEPWASPRTWFMAERVMTVAEILGYGETVKVQLLYGCIGEGMGKQFIEWRKNADLPEPEDVLAGKWKIDISRLDRCMAVYTTLASHVKDIPDHADRNKAAIKVYKLFKEAKDLGQGDLLATAVGQMIHNGFATQIKPTDPHATELTSAADAVLRTMGGLLSSSK